MAKTPWQVLGLAGPTSDKKAIKRAYAQQVKLYHPEDHPEEFQALQAAYQEALKRATELAAQESRGAGADFAGGRDPRPTSQQAMAQAPLAKPAASLLTLASRLRASRQIRGQPSRVTKSLASRPAQVAKLSPSGRHLSKRGLVLKLT